MTISANLRPSRNRRPSGVVLSPAAEPSAAHDVDPLQLLLHPATKESHNSLSLADLRKTTAIRHKIQNSKTHQTTSFSTPSNARTSRKILYQTLPKPRLVPPQPTAFCLPVRPSRRTVFVMEAFLLDVICCPETRQSLRAADAAALARASQVAGVSVTEGLIREDGMVLYPIRDGIPLLITDEAIRLA